MANYFTTKNQYFINLCMDHLPTGRARELTNWRDHQKVIQKGCWPAEFSLPKKQNVGKISLIETQSPIVKVDRVLIKARALQVMELLKIHQYDLTLSVVKRSEMFAANLSREHTSRWACTDVLAVPLLKRTFQPVEELERGKRQPPPQIAGKLVLGQLFICPPVLLKTCLKHSRPSHSLNSLFDLSLVHGLHQLLGYNYETEISRKELQEAEIRTLDLLYRRRLSKPLLEVKFTSFEEQKEYYEQTDKKTAEELVKQILQEYELYRGTINPYKLTPLREVYGITKVGTPEDENDQTSKFYDGLEGDEEEGHEPVLTNK